MTCSEPGTVRVPGGVWLLYIRYKTIRLRSSCLALDVLWTQLSLVSCFKLSQGSVSEAEDLWAVRSPADYQTEREANFKEAWAFSHIPQPSSANGVCSVADGDRCYQLELQSGDHCYHLPTPSNLNDLCWWRPWHLAESSWKPSMYCKSALW